MNVDKDIVSTTGGTGYAVDQPHQAQTSSRKIQNSVAQRNRKQRCSQEDFGAAFARLSTVTTLPCIKFNTHFEDLILYHSRLATQFEILLGPTDIARQRMGYESIR